MNWEGARTLSGLKQDDVDPDIYWSNEYKDPDQGIYKLQINRPLPVLGPGHRLG